MEGEGGELKALKTQQSYVLSSPAAVYPTASTEWSSISDCCCGIGKCPVEEGEVSEGGAAERRGGGRGGVDGRLTVAEAVLECRERAGVEKFVKEVQ